jgi:crotonobetainyl-CoA:carnitine CoA-transferase CaiB-like acyl-CoA transferase
MSAVRALEGVLVADFSRVLAGPLATMALGDLGATVIKVERPGAGDETRGWVPPASPDGTATYFQAVNRNKRSIALDLTAPEELTMAHRLVERADVVVENFLPGTMARFGLDYASLAASRPDLVYASVSGFGPHSSAAGYDFLIQAMGGLMSVTGASDGEPTKVGVALVDVLAGQNVLAGILAALYHRERTGAGQHIQVSLLGSVLAGLVNQASAYLNAGLTPQRMGNLHPSIAPYQTLRTADRPIAVAVGNDAQFRRLTAVVFGPDEPADPRFATNHLRVRHHDALTAGLESVLTQRPAAHWLPLLAQAGIPSGPINTIPEAFELAASLGLETVVPAVGEVRSVASPIGMSQTPPSYRLPPPSLDEHGTDIRRWLSDSESPLP